MAASAHDGLGRLMVEVGRLHHIRADQAMHRIGVYRGQAFLLMTLARRDGITHSEIAQALKISPAAATKAVKRAEQAGYVRRRTDAADERVSRVYLTEAGHALIHDIEQTMARLDGAMLAGLTQRDLERLRVLLLHMQANLQRIQS